MICLNRTPGEHSLGAFPLRCDYCKAHAAGKREGIEAAAKLLERESPNHAAIAWAPAIRALLQTEARAETGESGKR
jgi:hypothetical protein